MQTLKFIRIFTALTALTALTMVEAQGSTVVFSYPDGFASAGGAIRAAWEAGYSGSAINLTNIRTEHQAGAAWYTKQVDIRAFSTDFTFQLQVAGGKIDAQGIAFVVQNTNASTNPGAYGDNAGGDANLMGYGTYVTQTPMAHSIAVKFDLSGANGQNQYPANHIPNATGLYINGGPQGGLIPEIDLGRSGVNLHLGHVMAAHVVYDGSILTLTLRDTVTGTQFRQSWPVNIPAITGSNLAWVGFTGGTIPVVSQKLLSWSFSTGYPTRLAPPTFSLGAGAYPSEQSVTLSGPAGAAIYYTTDGQQPTTASNKYSGPIAVASSEIVRAIAVQANYTDSVVAEANYRIAANTAPLLNFPSGFTNAANLVETNGAAQFSGSAIQLTDATNLMEVGSAFYVVPVNVQSFTTDFTIEELDAQANGLTFTIQNQPPVSLDPSILHVSGGPNILANNQTGLGYSGYTNGAKGQLSGLLTSVAVKFDLTSNTTGLYTNGASPTTSDVSITGVNLRSGNPLNVVIAYDGKTLKMTITDTKTKASFSKGWGISIPATVAGTSAYVGFTASTGYSSALQKVLSWTYSTSGSTAALPVPSAPTDLRVQ